MNISNEKLIDATLLAPAVKHQIIIETFEQLQAGESFILQNDHDPKPLYYQFKAEHGEIFTWDYLEEGPEIFKIRIAKNATENKDENLEGKYLDATTLDMSVKFQTIMSTFTGLKDGEHFILHNNFDPIPLQSQLKTQFGEIFTWEYLKQGPDFFDIKIGKKETQSAKSEEFILNGIELDPAVKFQTIMNTFNQLQAGEAFILHNDHDPKPLFYQLSSTQGDTFTWEYLKQGPDVFDIRIGKKMISENEPANIPTHENEIFEDHIEFPEDSPETVRTIVAKDFRKIKVFQKYRMDYGWKADISIADICNRHAIDEAQLRAELGAVENDFSESIPSYDYYHWDMSFLADFILRTHHQYVKNNAERIALLAEEVGKTHGGDSEILDEICKSVRPMLEDFMVHMSKEEDVLFPAIKQMLRLLQKGEKSKGPGGAIKNAVIKMEEEHDETKEFLDAFREATEDYKVQGDTAESIKSLYRELQLFEQDTYMHVHLENNILFPKLILLEAMITE